MLSLFKSRFSLLIITAIILVIIVFILLVLTVLTPSEENENNSQPLPTQVQPQITSPNNVNVEDSPEYKTTLDEANKELKTISDRATAITYMQKRLPYIGTNFSMRYSFETNDFIVNFNSQNPTAGREEFDQFLNENDVEESWIRNLTIVNE